MPHHAAMTADADALDVIRITDPSVVVVAEGATEAARNAARGSLFEEFVALLLSRLGYEPPERRRLKVTLTGIELDVLTKLVGTGQPAIVECKAYSANIDAQELDAFYGKLTTARFREPNTFGWFFALPRFTGPGDEQARLIQQNDDKFRVITATDLVRILDDQRLIAPLPPDVSLSSDLAVIVSEPGVYSAVKELDEATRLPLRIRIWAPPSRVVPEPVLKLVAASPYGAEGLPVVSHGGASSLPESVEPTIVEVTGSSSDFEYQLPASPPFFVGRTRLLNELRRYLNTNPARGRVLVINAQSGWGKSSLALRLQEIVEERGGLALVADTRTASAADYVPAVLRRLLLRAEEAGLVEIPSAASYASLPSALQTIAQASWTTPSQVLLIVFDQFENVFRDEDLTRAFRDLALSVTELAIPLVVGFAWKTDFIAWSETHPYQLRDDIRDRAETRQLPPFGARDIDVLLRRLADELDEELQLELRQRLAEYCQGLPWLFKKLAGHVIAEIRSGVSQESLIAEGLNIERLFRRDVAELSPPEVEGLRTLARMAPAAISDAIEVVSRETIQALLHRRLVVQVGERLDTYWDHFRDYLLTGSVPIRETYLIRQSAPSVGRLVRELVNAGGELSVQSAAARLRTSDRGVYNLARELRQLGLATAARGTVRLDPAIQGADDRDAAMRERAEAALRRHAVYDLLLAEVDRHGGRVRLGDFASALPSLFPAVTAKQSTWRSYGRAFVSWARFAGLVSVLGENVSVGGRGDETLSLVAGFGQRSRTPGTFPQGRPEAVIAILRFLFRHQPELGLSTRDLRRAISDGLALGLIEIDDEGTIAPTSVVLSPNGELPPEALRQRLTRIQGGSAALDLLKRVPSASTFDVGAVLSEGQGAAWTKTTTEWMGKLFRAWARAAGVPTSHARRRISPDQLTTSPQDG